MPERLASTDPCTQVAEVVGSGPFRFLADERVSGARVAYARFEGYRPRAIRRCAANGGAGWFGWPTAPRLEALRDEWLAHRTTATASASPPRSRNRPSTTCRSCRSDSSSSRPPGRGL